ncbi:bifunctional molybdopterin-guanine dinucleotide biosynthesis adaptor protein MobB/molybdopterin molybdotransferase MoeA [Amaricoccus sp.]|uniref:bifunctional molybdopterin-guanine dinucleotide biosynthesis adaptor protein MobB/molybdopterin molybdotransferase MoeA n=1 Tax=Amaricoccus sp. TaxID=1872485 RepID=UPI00262620A4|nr:bifunctional molybdopterin-guanine dinucleotide biosynthesis adaptor protein MobB/molybdopterin molybdotransferase MoeA [Amaricoccus sp.]HRO11836.1 bifunctional molybdopterin-guanine dinucleotide biosynthesis adaptor protein MobB/molybdopterin molybdotransferase MoeA [Amaricoccus sp.]
MRVYGVTGWKNSGKTTLLERLVAHLVARGLTVATVKHAHHAFEPDQPGKDSHRHRMAGAAQVLVASSRRWALITELAAPEPPLEELLAHLAPADLVLVEGYKRDRHPKIETRRAATAQDLIAEGDETIEAVASDTPLPGLPVPVFPLDDIPAIADFILARTGLAPTAGATPPGGRVTVAAALDRLRAATKPVAETETVPLAEAGGHILAAPVHARRANPPAANAAVDGYGLAHATLGPAPYRLPLVLPLVQGRAAAGAPFPGAVPPGQALRILTGALLPRGVDTVVPEEEVTLAPDAITLPQAPAPRANTRPAGEDVQPGAEILPAGRRLGPPELALAAASGLGLLPVRRRLRVAVLSTGDEIRPAGSDAAPHQTWDANRPMLLEMLRRWEMIPVDLGQAADDPAAVSAALDRGAARADAILTTGGASAGDEDHVTALLRAGGGLDFWRVAVKPGRPFALGRWAGRPILGLPGNPVAAFVCALVLARPALLRLAGAPWQRPAGLLLPAAFAKEKSGGRHEYLRARLDPRGAVEVFPSEGSGRVSGLAWSTGLVELEDAPRAIRPGDPVRYLPLADFGL